MATDPERPFLGCVLVAASDPDLRLYVRHGLEGLAREVVEAADGLEALERLGGRRVDLAVADARMPRLDGLELGRVLAGRGMPVLLLDGDTTVEGGVAVLAKPFDHRQLRSAARAAATAGLSLAGV